MVMFVGLARIVAQKEAELSFLLRAITVNGAPVTVNAQVITLTKAA